MRECSQYEITIEQFYNFAHRYTEKIKIHVIFSGLKDWELKSPRQHDYYLTENMSKSPEEAERVIKYYGNVPIWSLHTEAKWEPVTGRKGFFICCYLVANCHYADVFEGRERERKDRERERRKRKEG